MKQLLDYFKNKYILFSIQFLVATAITVAGFHYTPIIKHKYWIYQHIKLIEDFIDVLTQYPKNHLRYTGIHNAVIRKEYKDQFDKRLIFHDDNNIEFELGGYFIVYPGFSDYKSYRDDALILSYVNLDMERCLELATYDWTKIKSAKVLGVMAAKTSNQLDFDTMYKGCDGTAVRDVYTVACTDGRNISIPMPEEHALTACRCYNNSCSLTFKLY
ncbi:MAG: hypothetical protein J6N49_06890 [Alphaproteobacteria bacterium]|nr:hypothetical protein [Alphaproteobacteria bacterium]